MRQRQVVTGAVCLITITAFFRTQHMIMQTQQRHQDHPLSSPIINRSKNIILPVYNKTNKPSRIVWQTWVTKEVPEEARGYISEMEKANPDYEFK
jgi:mannosyltransferase OCH1-like enzyme